MWSSYFAISIKTLGTNHCFKEHLKTNHSDSIPFDCLKDSPLPVNFCLSVKVSLIYHSLTSAYHPFCCLLYPYHNAPISWRPLITDPFHFQCYSPTPVFLFMPAWWIHYNHSLSKILISFVPPFLRVFTLQNPKPGWLSISLSSLLKIHDYDHRLGTQPGTGDLQFPSESSFSCSLRWLFSYLLPASSSCPTLNLTCASQKIRSHQNETPFSSKQICETTYTYFHILSWFLLLVIWSQFPLDFSLSLLYSSLFTPAIDSPSSASFTSA